MHFSRPAFMAFAVSAMIGGFESPHFPNFTHRFITVKVGHHDINQNSVNVRRMFQKLDALTAVLGKQHFHVLAFFNPSSKSKPDMSGKAKSTTMQSK